MRILLPSCRSLLNAVDVEFLVRLLTDDQGNRDSLRELLRDAGMRDLVLDTPMLVSVVRCADDDEGSAQLRAYVLLRQEPSKRGISSRRVADYVATVLVSFADFDEQRCDWVEQFREIGGDSEWGDVGSSCTAERVFSVQQYVANLVLFVTGVLGDSVVGESTGGRTLDYYEGLGSDGFLRASEMRLAFEFDLVDVFRVLGKHFHAVRLALQAVAALCHIPIEATQHVTAPVQANPTVF